MTGHRVKANTSIDHYQIDNFLISTVYSNAFAKDDADPFICLESHIRTRAGAKGSPKDASREYSTHKFTIQIKVLNNFLLTQI